MSDTGKYLSGRDYWDSSIVMTHAAQKLHSTTSIMAPYEGNLLEITIVVACHNNQDTVIQTLDTIREAMEVVGKSFEIIVVDDGSKDHSAEMVRGYMAEFPHLNILLRINHKKKGPVLSYVDGAFIGQGKYYRMVYADASEAVETVVDVLRALGEADIIVPYYVSMHKKGFWDRFSAGWFSWWVNVMSGHQVSRYSGLHVHLRYNVMRWRPVTMGPLFQTDLLCQLLDLGFTCKQVPCRAMPERAALSTGGKLKNFLSGLHILLELLIRRISNQMHE